MTWLSRWPFSLEAKLGAGLFVISGLLVVTALIVYASTMQVDQSARSIAHTLEILQELDYVVGQVRAAESAQRGYVLTGDTAFLAPYETALPQIESSLRQLEHLLRDRPSQKDRLVALTRVIRKRSDVMEHVLDIARTYGLSPAQQEIAKREGLIVMDAVIQEAASISAEEARALEERNAMFATSMARLNRSFWVEILLFVLILAMGYVLIFRDLSRRRETVHMLQRARLHAEESAKLKSEFLANMSHEIRTPMNGILGMVGLLSLTPLNREQEDCVRTLRESCESLLAILNDILDFSKIEAGHLELEAAPIDVRLCVEEVLDLMAPLAGDKPIDLAARIDDSLPVVIGDQVRLRQVLTNLVSNAIKFTREGEIVVGARCQPGAKAGMVTVELEVVDSGIGIEPEAFDRIFQVFSQVDSSTTRRFGGTGLGLAISKRLVEMMGGSISLESTPPKGSVFRFTIAVPVARDEHSKPSLKAPAELVGKRVLAADDNAVQRDILTQLLTGWDMVADVVSTAEDAIARIRRAPPPDLALIDESLGGADLVSRLAEIQPDLRAVVLASPSPVKSLPPRTLRKPLRPSRVLQVLVEAFGLAQSPASHRPEPANTSLAQKNPLRILVAEDQPVNQLVAVRLLEIMGYQPKLVANGCDALESLRQGDYDVVFMDIQMPVMDGYEATRLIRAVPVWKMKPYIIAMTAHALVGDRERCLREGMNDYISKPIRIRDLEEALGRARDSLSTSRPLLISSAS
jgi:signal transduction histidine kinase/DNA-binding response OmpR family regulator